ncbi:MAG: CPBP family intramembrane metalloprotease [Lachnospiraceae bacterium]|nr:CPBP family intramembrane metalloprotease [Lachnospiraceae bacterium]
MKKIYEKNELTFSLIWIGVYVVLFSVADSISLDLGTAKIITVPVCLFMTIFLAVWIVKNGLSRKYGLCKMRIDYKRYLYFLPLVVIASTNLWCGVSLHLSIFETILYVISMICVGFIEEVIFRGFLFQALCRENVKRAIVISSITFGIGHIVNLLNGAELIPTLLQICYAIAIGFLFTVIFYQSESLIPCIVTHSLINSLSVVAGDGTEALNIVTAIVLTVISGSYAIWLLSNRVKGGKN